MYILALVLFNSTWLLIGIDGDPIGLSGQMHKDQCESERAYFVKKYWVPSGMLTCFKLE